MFVRSKNENKLKNLLNNVPNYQKLLKTSWNYQASQFFEKSTLHGVRYIAEHERPFLEKFMWFCCVTIGAIATMIIIVSLWGKFQTNPTITGLDTDFHRWDVTFPALTLCEINPSNDSYIEAFLERHWLNLSDENIRRDFLVKLSQLNYENLEDFKRLIKFITTDIDLRQIIYEVTSKCDDILFECTWKDEPYNCCMGFYPLFTEHGFCYTFNSRHYEMDVPWLKDMLPSFELRFIEETDVKWSFTFNSYSPKMLVFIHNPDEVPSIDTNPQHVWDQRVNKISFSMKQTYTTSDAKQLSIKQRHCTFADEIKLKIDSKMYTYAACTRECRMETSQRLCGCIPLFYPLVDGFKYCQLKEMDCVITNRKQILNVDRCKCELGCSNTVYEVEKLTERTDPSTTSLESEFVSWPMVRYKREVLFGWVDLLVSFGGIAGLFLGFSLLSGVEIIYYFTIRACCMVYKERPKVERLQRYNELTTNIPTTYDLSLKPHIPKKNNLLFVQPVQESRQIFKLKQGGKIKPANEVLPPPFGIEFVN